MCSCWVLRSLGYIRAKIRTQRTQYRIIREYALNYRGLNIMICGTFLNALELRNMEYTLNYRGLNITI